MEHMGKSKLKTASGTDTQRVGHAKGRQGLQHEPAKQSRPYKQQKQHEGYEEYAQYERYEQDKQREQQKQHKRHKQNRPKITCAISGKSITGFWRLYEIDKLISQGLYPNCSYLADHLEVHKRTVERDIERLRDLFAAPIEYDRKKKGYYYTEPFSLPPVRLREGEAIALFLGQKLLAQCKGTPLEEFVENAMLKIRMLLSQEIDVSLERVVEAVSFHVDPLRGEEVEVAQNYGILVDAMEQRRVVEMEYYSASRDAHTRRRIEPYHLRLVGGAWYCIAYCHNRREVRTFALDRMQSLTITEERFEIPKDFSISEYLGHSWIIERGTPTRVVIEFDSSQVPHICNKQWHHSQKLETLPDGSLRMTLTTGSLGEIMRWVLSFGSHARIIEPEALRRQVIAELDKARRNYD
jgi:predicted DNA-binding transcriptional regulator YafY